MALSGNFGRILSRPAEVWWAGFRSNTYELQRSGWEIAAEEDPRECRVSLILRHKQMALYAITDRPEYDYHRSMHHEGPLPLFRVVQCAPNIQFRHMATMVSQYQFDNYRQIDAMPQYTAEAVKSIEDLKIFSTPLVRTEELIVEPQTVAAMLDQIRQMQIPEQERIRARERARERRESYDVAPQQTFHAQIISLSDRSAA